MYKGTIVENSLKDKSILKELSIVRTQHSGDWILHDVLLRADQITRLGEYLTEGPWYIHVWQENDPSVIVIFRDAMFTINMTDVATWAEAIAHGKLMGIPESQLDFKITI